MVREIPLTKGYVALVDDEDFDRVSFYKWHVSFSKSGGNYYAVRFENKGKSRKKIYLHRFILSIEDSSTLVDHKNLDTLDCRRENMRYATREQNNQNRRKGKNGRHQYKGICLIQNTWSAQIHANGRHHYLGCFPTEVDAARAYDEAARSYFGEFANLNFPELLEAA